MRKEISIRLTAWVLLFCSASAWAQDGYTAPTLESEFPWRAIGATAICFAGILLAGLKNSRRSQTKAN
ncbi:MAG: hypothetical protein JW849_07125 [Phycisphaerae bacterium]|nr:hypothetical protein [Phycisphaerae bacterium]